MNELVYLKNDEAVCDSLQVAERFEKRHADVIRAIENLIKNDSTQNCVRCFKKEKYKDAKGQGSKHAEMLYMTYSKLANKMAGIEKRDEATVMQLNNLSLMEHIILNVIDAGILMEKNYKLIYQDCKNRLELVKDLAYLEQTA